ncbi:MAG TPA: cytochrome c4 [Casimicrobiaceae bacterium]|nr:cytochrome c4 [Casimicrobiaceae bacterium]
MAGSRSLVLAVALFACATPLRAQLQPTDTLAQRVAPCTACHDDTGRRGRDAYYPRIAGKPAGYLFNQLVHFREGRRYYALMTYLVDHMTDSYVTEIAEYFANLERPYPAPPPSKASPNVLERGRVLALEGDRNEKLPSCAECHGRSLTGIAPAIPAVVGLPRDYVSAQLNNWKAGVRRSLAPDCMADIAKRMRADDITAVATWLATQPVLGKAIVATERLPLECGVVTPAK